MKTDYHSISITNEREPTIVKLTETPIQYLKKTLEYIPKHEVYNLEKVILNNGLITTPPKFRIMLSNLDTNPDEMIKKFDIID